MNISKEKAARIYNLYSQIDTTQTLIEDLERFIKECNEHSPRLIPEGTYDHFGSIEISVPYWEEGRFKVGSARVCKIKYPAALKVLKSHIRSIKKELKQTIEECGKDETD